MDNIFFLAKKMSDSFFDGLKKSAVDRAVAKAKKDREPDPIIEKMEELEREREELDELLKKYSE